MAHSKRPASHALLSALTFVAIATTVTLIAPIPVSAESTYVVEPGDTLSVIAREHGVSTTDLVAANGISNRHLIRIGQTLTVPSAQPTVHTVGPGDSVSVIARTYGVSSADIVALNSLADINRIRIGQKLLLPGGARSSAAAPTENLAASYPSLPARIRDNPDRLALIPSFERWSAHYGVPRDLLMALAYQESGWQSSVVSHKGAVGIGQLLPRTSAWVASDLIGIPSLDPNVPDDNIRMSARFLLWLLGSMGGEQNALAGYYQGPTSVRIHGQYTDTRLYVGAIEAARWRFARS
ncbi:MAG: LysM peptidoglycan-binding domain-containing protein [Acidimicrobiales bacterium]